MTAPRKGFSGTIRRGPMAADVLGKFFTQVFNAAARDRRLSRRARGLMVEIMSHSDGFVINEAALIAGGPEGRDAIRTALKELERYGYLHRVQGRDGGRFAETEFEITDMPEGLLIGAAAPWAKPEEAPSAGSEENRRSEPSPENPSTASDEENRRSAPLPEKPATAKPATANPQHKKNTPGGGSTPSGGEDSLSGHDRPSGDGPEAEGEREAATPQKRGNSEFPGARENAPSEADVVVAAYEAAAGRRLVNGARQRLRAQAVRLLAAGREVGWLAERAAEMPAQGWTDLEMHAGHPRHLLPQQAGPATGGGAPGGERRSTPAEVEALRARVARMGSGL